MAQLDGTIQRIDARRWGSGDVELTRVELIDGAGRPGRLFHTGEPFTIRMHYRATRPVERPVFGVAVHAGQTHLLSGPNTRHHAMVIPCVEGEGYVDLAVPALPLLRGDYYVSASVYDWTLRQAYDHHDRTYPFHVESSPGHTVFGVLELPGATWRHAVGAAESTAGGTGQMWPVSSVHRSPPENPPA